MNVADEYLVRSKGRIFHYEQAAVGERFSRVAQSVRAKAAAISDDELLQLDLAAWAESTHGELAVQPPSVDIAAVETVDEGRIQVDCTGMPGISYSLMEPGGQWLRDGNRLRLIVPGSGELALLCSRTDYGETGYVADVLADRIERVYDWPHVLAADQLNEDIDRFLNSLDLSCKNIAEQVERRNAEIAGTALQELESRRQNVLASRSFLGALRVPVKKSAAAEARIPNLPAPRPKPRALATRPADAVPVVDGPTLDDFYEHVLDVIRNTTVGLERSPGRFAPRTRNGCAITSWSR
jgi:hypothetical protein